MKLVEFLDHSQKILFHGTHFVRLPEIINADKIEAKTTDTAIELKRLAVGAGVSLTRSYAYAMRHRGGTKRSVVLVLDASHLKTIPVDYWNGEGEKYNRVDELEEFHPGPIFPLSRYLISINSTLTYEEWLVALGRKPKCKYSMIKKLWNVWQPIKGLVR